MLEYQLKYRLGEEFRVIPPKTLEDVVEGRISSAEKVYEVCQKARAEKVSTLLTAHTQEVLQFIVLSSGTDRLRELTAFTTEKATNPVHCEDTEVFRNSDELKWILENAKEVDYYTSALKKTDWNKGPVIHNLKDVGCTSGEKVTAGYLIVQERDGIAYSEIVLDPETFQDFQDELEISDDVSGAIEYYLMS